MESTGQHCDMGKVDLSRTRELPSQSCASPEGHVCAVQIQGVGSAANITQADLRTCGASIVHIIDNVLLPFNPVTGPVPDG